ncbi:MAG: hypothetical protein EP330_24770 [Deltaproteobacteria bacterium]|nr:MAG: hypothetical protein EP330_24770 [Deltaproteobacteria bacterium]
MLLVVNDHVLKVWWPSALTGKLSDLAFLVVAPVVLAALLSYARVPELAAKRLGIGVIGLFFIGLQVWPALGDTVAGWLGGRHTPDLTDLAALPALALVPLAWRPTPRIPVALPFAALACVATSWDWCPDTRYPLDGETLDPNEPLMLRWGRDTPPGDHPALPPSVHLFDADGVEVPLLFADGVKVCPVGGLEPSATYTFVISEIEPPGSNTTWISFGDVGISHFTTLPTSTLEPIRNARDCREAQVLGELRQCWEDEGVGDTADTADTSL